MRTSVVVLALIVRASAARADDVRVARPGPAWMFTVGGLARATARDGDAETHRNRLEAYGYRVRPAAMTGLRGDLAYGHAPIVDLGVAWAWGRGTYARGPGDDDADELTGSTRELGVFARLHWARRDARVAAEPRVEVGVAQASITLRDLTRRRTGAYTRLGLDVRLGGRRAGALLSIDYTAQHRAGDLDLDVPTGGVTFGASFYWRQWD